MRIPQETIDQIRAATDIVEFIGTVVRLKKRGKDYLGLCPFHNEKTPSFSVSPSKQLFYCFGCHRGGDAVKFAMEYYKTGYVEALETLAERAHIPITRTEEAFESANETEKLHSVMAFAARFFYHNLTKTSEGEFAMEYFRKRGFSSQTVTTFGLGYSMKGWETLVRAAEGEGIDTETLAKVGLVRRRDDGTAYDTFRGRAMFPIFSTAGRVIAFGARKLYEDDNLGKYINSSETPVYHKSRVLYGLSHAKESIRQKDSVVMVEGYADLISVFQAGVKNIVASSGTALTSEQVQLIARYTKNVTLVYDADSAGANAMMRGVDLVLEGGLDVRVAQLPEGEDPDSFVRKEGVEAFEDRLKKAISFVEFKAEEFRRAGTFETPEGRTAAVRALVQTIGRIPDPIKRAFFIKEVAAKYDLYESTLMGELEKSTRRVPEKFAAPVKTEAETPPPETAAPPVPAELPIEERDLFIAVVEDPKEMIPFIFRDLQPSDFSHPVSRHLAVAVLNEFDEHGTVDVKRLMQSAPDETARGIIGSISFNRYELSERWNDIGAKLNDSRLYEFALGAIKTLRRKKLEKELTDVRAAMKNAAASGADPLPHLKRQQEIFARLKEIDALKLMKG